MAFRQFVELLRGEILDVRVVDALTKLDDVLLHAAQFIGPPLEFRLLFPSGRVRLSGVLRTSLRRIVDPQHLALFIEVSAVFAHIDPAAVREDDGPLANIGKALLGKLFLFLNAAKEVVGAATDVLHRLLKALLRPQERVLPLLTLRSVFTVDGCLA